MELLSKLRAREAEGNPVRVGIIGCGQMGSGLAHTICDISGMRVTAIADIDVDRAVATYRDMGIPSEAVRVTETENAAADALRAGLHIVSPDALQLARLEGLDANVEATGNADIGAQVAHASIQCGKPIIMLNAEADVTVGAYLSHLARSAGSLYTVASGDEPGVCKMLYEQAVLMGFEVVCLGKGKNNPVNHHVTPDQCVEEAHGKGMNPKMLCSFIDGTKTMVEMAAVSNATGLLPDVPGMHGPRVEVDDLVTTFIPREDGGLFSRRGVVEYSTGKVAPGVYAIVYSDNPRIRKEMKFITHAEGPYYLHFRPYHLCDLETPQSIAEAVLLNEVTVAAETQHSEVVCRAKRDLQPGCRVEGIGGSDWHGVLLTRREARERRAIPIGLAENGTVTAPVDCGDYLRVDNLQPDETTFVYQLRRQQDAWLTEGES